MYGFNFGFVCFKVCWRRRPRRGMDLSEVWIGCASEGAAAFGKFCVFFVVCIVSEQCCFQCCCLVTLCVVLMC